MTKVDGAKLLGGLWLPATEEHFVTMMKPGAKRHEVRDGRWTYQVHKLDRAMSYLSEGRRRAAIDIGGHAGLWSIHLQHLFRTVHAFEPVPLHAACFRANVLGDNVQLHECALGSEAGRVAMHVPEDTTGNAHVATTTEPRSNGHGPISEVKDIALRPLDDFGFCDVDFVKIDVEGYELSVIEGARATLLREKPLLVVEQKGNDAKFFNQPRNAALDFLLALGMTRLDMISGDHILGW